jgi:DNA-binding SARP family transcriptional activator
VRDLLVQFGSPELAAQALSVSREHVALNPAIYQSDADLLGRTLDLACQHEAQEGLDAAVSLYHQVVGLYDGAYMEAVPRGNDWGSERRDLLANAYLLAAERLAEHTFSQGHYRECMAHCRAALVVDPAAEDVVTWLLRAYAQLGLTVDVDHAYRQYLEAAGIDPLCEPDDAVVRTYDGIRGHAAARR